ncbi:RNA polymerase sigma factor [Mangrovibacterium lignilyticum]|uniref:RNA polymerase sigma factor n=1 Tax=Mangrovibacterium lignilyticum TaxID=2668052 RepID=UPI0013D5E3CD|nr:sigma-70 family RNA polymerase sigma factor [Mangrovibacterium lignilyticum]
MPEDLDEKEWFALTFDKHYEYIRNYLYYLSGDIALAEDLSQDVFLQVWEERAHVNRQTVRSYLFAIAQNSYFKYHRRKNVKLNFINSLLNENEHESPEFLLELKEFGQKLQGVIAEIPDKTRAIFLMSRIDSMSYSEIAVNLDISNKAVEKHMSKALKYLRSKVDRKL